MASRKPTRSKRSPRRPAVSSGKAGRFIQTVVVAAVATFGVTTYALHPQALDRAAIEPILARLGVPGQPVGAPVLATNAAHVSTQFPGCREHFPNGQPPVVPSRPLLRELCFPAFAVLHSGQTRTPVFVAQRLNRQMLTRAQQVQRTDRFYQEARLPAAERATLDDYRGSGYSRGHMAPAGDMHTPAAMAQSFSLANIVPQDQQHNAGPWNKIEQDTRRYVMRASGDVFIITGPVYGVHPPQTIGASRVAVPTHFYKLVYDGTTRRAWAYWQANTPDTRPGPPITYEELVRRIDARLL